jgi:hypothetical protein
VWILGRGRRERRQKKSATEETVTRRLVCKSQTICVLDATPQGEHPLRAFASTMLHLSIVNHNNCNNRMASNFTKIQARVESVEHAS